MQKALGELAHAFLGDSLLLIDGEGVLAPDELNLGARSNGLDVDPNIQLSVGISGWDRTKPPADPRFCQ
jgi:hypothetical protein